MMTKRFGYKGEKNEEDVVADTQAAEGMLDKFGGVDGLIKKLATDANVSPIREILTVYQSGIIGDERDLQRRANM